MTLEMSAIRSCYEQGMSPEQIADDRELTVDAVKVALMSCCPAYKRACGTEPETEDKLNFTNEQLERVNQIIYETAVGADDPALQLKAAMYIRDDKKGRKDVVKQVGGFQFNVLQIDARMRKAMAAISINQPKLLKQ